MEYTHWDFITWLLVTLTEWLHFGGLIIRKCMGVSPGQNKVALITRWSYQRGDRKAGFCTFLWYCGFSMLNKVVLSFGSMDEILNKYGHYNESCEFEAILS